MIIVVIPLYQFLFFCGYLFFLATTTSPMDGTHDPIRRVFHLYLGDYLSGTWWFLWPAEASFSNLLISVNIISALGFFILLYLILIDEKDCLGGFL